LADITAGKTNAETKLAEGLTAALTDVKTLGTRIYECLCYYSQDWN
jgi:type IV pilus assembly protein PilA